MAKTEWKPFEQALLDAALEEFADIPAEDEIDLEFSEEFEEAGAALVAQTRRGKTPGVGKVLRRVLLVAAIIAALTTTVMATQSFRDAVIKVFAQNAGTHYEFSFDPEQAANAPEYIEKAYNVAYVPEGYDEDTKFINIGIAAYIWYNESVDSYISFCQYPIPNDTEGPWPNSEDVVVETLNLNGYEVFCVHDEGTAFYWTDNEYFFEMYFDPDVSEEDINKMFFSIYVDVDAVIEE